MTDDERQIRRLVDSWIAASEAGDVPALLALMTDDVIFVTPGRPPFGRAEFAAGAELNKGVAVHARAEIQEIEIIGSCALIRNLIEVVVTAPDASPRRMSGYTLSVCAREPTIDGASRVTRNW